MSQGNFADDNEGYTRKVDVIAFYESIHLPQDTIIGCPFDTKESAFVRVFESKGYKVIYSHIDNEQDFYTYEPEHYDVIISNPPFKGKAKLMERLLELNKPFALIFGIQCFNSGEFTALLSKVPNLQMIFLQRRIKFHKGDETITLPSPTFHSMGIMNNMNTSKQINFILLPTKVKRKPDEQH